jgi:hypothetical protein
VSKKERSMFVNGGSGDKERSMFVNGGSGDLVVETSAACCFFLHVMRHAISRKCSLLDNVGNVWCNGEESVNLFLNMCVSKWCM